MLKLLGKKITVSFLLISIMFLNGCMRYLTQDRNDVLLKGIDVNQTLQIVRLKMEERHGKFGASLPVWVIRDQDFTADQAKEISKLYFNYVDSLEKKFDKWHMTWAISNIYRIGNDSIKEVISDAFMDASKRAHQLGGIADKMVNGDKIFMGDAHSGGRAFARKHIVVPGNKKYLQSFGEYKKEGR